MFSSSQIVYSFIQSNLFIPCWREMKQVASLCEGKGTMSESYIKFCTSCWHLLESSTQMCLDSSCASTAFLINVTAVSTSVTIIMTAVLVIISIAMTIISTYFRWSSSIMTRHHIILAVNEGQGVLQLRLKVGNYHQGIKLKIPPLYPEEGVTIEFLSSNFPKDMQYMFRCQGGWRHM